MNISPVTLSTLSKLRPPFTRSAYCLFPYTNEGLVNAGITVEVLVGEPAVAPGSGMIQKIYTVLPSWQTTVEELRKTTVSHVVIDHGNSVMSVVGGIQTLSVKPGQMVYRGDKLGDLLVNQLFVSVSVGSKTVNPTAVNKHWILQNGSVVVGQSGKIRFAPDRLVRDLSHGVTALFNQGVRYFYQLVTPTPLLINVSFNGDGSKTGLAATGYLDTDYWNSYMPSDFLATASYACSYYYAYYSGYGYGSFSMSYQSFTADSVVRLNDYTGSLSSVFIERIAPLFSASGSSASWDSMLKSWVGGYLGPVPYENTFRLRNMPAGTYKLYVYADKGSYPSASTFYVSVSSGMPTALGNNPAGSTTFVESSNYVVYTLTVPTKGYITLKAVGYLSGLQLQRV